MTDDEAKAVIAEIRALCERHGVGLVGVCESEAIYGEIRIVELARPQDSGWSDVEHNLWNFDWKKVGPDI